MVCRSLLLCTRSFSRCMILSTSNIAVRRLTAFDPTVACFIENPRGWRSCRCRGNRNRQCPSSTRCLSSHVLNFSFNSSMFSYPVARAVYSLQSCFSRVVSRPVTVEAEAWACDLHIAQQLAFCVLDQLIVQTLLKISLWHRAF